LAEKCQELELVEAQYKESELNREKLRRSIEDKNAQIRLLQEEVDSLRVSVFISTIALGLTFSLSFSLSPFLSLSPFHCHCIGENSNESS
jgi:hypothetical protein